MAKYNNIYHRKDGRWEGRVLLGRNPSTGKPQYKTFYGKTQSEVRQKIKNGLALLEDGVQFTGEKWELGKWLDHWLSNYKRNEIAKTTYDNYRFALVHIKNAIGKSYLADLNTDMIQLAINELAQSGRKRTVKITHCILSAALDQAVENGLLAKNPAKAVVLPRQQSKNARVLSVEDQQLFIRALRGQRLSNLFMLQIATGLRPGEALGLTWDNVDFENKILHITKAVRRERDENDISHMVFAPTKTKRSRDMELLDEAIEILKRQRELQNAEKNRLGNAYTDLNLIFATKTGQILERPHVAQTLALIRKQMRIIRAEELHKDISEVEEPDFTLHSLRHTFATRALEQDIPLKVVSDWLGHTTIRITGDIYSHALPAKRRNSIQRLTGITTDHYKNGQNRGQVQNDE